MYRDLLFPNFKCKALTLSYDDGVIYDKKLINIMNKYGLKGTFNLNSGLFAEKSGGRLLTREEAIKLYKDSGNEIAIHGYKHLSLGEINRSLGLLDVIKDKENLENAFGRIIYGLAYANGSYSDSVVEMLKQCNVKYARTTISTGKYDIPTDWLRLPTTCHHTDAKLMDYVEEFLSFKYEWNSKPKLFYLWGHSYEFNDNNNWEVFEEFAKSIGEQEDIWYATNGEIYDYIQSYNKLEFSSDGRIIHNPTNIDLYFRYFYKKTMIKAGETKTIELQ